MRTWEDVIALHWLLTAQSKSGGKAVHRIATACCSTALNLVAETIWSYALIIKCVRSSILTVTECIDRSHIGLDCYYCDISSITLPLCCTPKSLSGFGKRRTVQDLGSQPVLLQACKTCLGSRLTAKSIDDSNFLSFCIFDGAPKPQRLPAGCCTFTPFILTVLTWYSIVSMKCTADCWHQPPCRVEMKTTVSFSSTSVANCPLQMW